jgi:tripartite-type tricarboxylate transporter receptor subunit TctC
MRRLPFGRLTAPLCVPLCALVSVPLCALPVFAQDAYPARPITLIVGISPGASADLIARTFGGALSKRLNQAVVVENKVGASGRIALDHVAKSAPNGYTLALMVNSYTFLPVLTKSLPFDLVTDFAPIAKVATAPLGLAVHPAVPARNLKELIPLLKANPGKYTYATPGNGTIQHVSMEMFKLEMGVDVLHVPHKAIADATNNLVGGHVDMTFGSAPTLVNLSSSGKLKLLAVSGPLAGSAAGAAPTFADLGYPSLNELTQWYGFVGPAKTPPAIVARLNGELKQIVEMPEVKTTLMEKQGLGLSVGSPDEMGTLIRNDIERWRRIVREAKITLE